MLAVFAAAAIASFIARLSRVTTNAVTDQRVTIFLYESVWLWQKGTITTNPNFCTRTKSILKLTTHCIILAYFLGDVIRSKVRHWHLNVTIFICSHIIVILIFFSCRVLRNVEFVVQFHFWRRWWLIFRNAEIVLRQVFYEWHLTSSQNLLLTVFMVVINFVTCLNSLL